MKIEIFVDEKATDLSISITCKQLTSDVEKLLATLRMMNHQLTARKDNEIHLLDIAQIIYIESVDRKCFLYTSHAVYESDFKLYEPERQLEEYGFFRASKLPLWLRTLCMLTAGVVIVAAFVIVFHWFPTDMWQPWVMFLISFGVSFVGSYVVMIVKEKTENRRMDEVFGLLGPSGAGKTTLIKLLTGQLRQDEGCAWLLGKDTRELGASEHLQIGGMMDNFGLYDLCPVSRSHADHEQHRHH